jgi:hypothetical protein
LGANTGDGGGSWDKVRLVRFVGEGVKMCKDGKENISSDSGQGLAWALALFSK